MQGAPAKSCPSCAEPYDADVLFCPRDGTPLTRSVSATGVERDPYLGIELPGQITLEHLIGIGSMGRVYRAFQGGIERDVAVKVLHRELSGNAELVARFHREAKVASRLVHPNVVQVLMTGALPRRGEAGLGGELYLVMEHLDGISLLSALAAAGTSSETAALPLLRALHVALQVCDAVGEAHAQGIVHRDIKPENVMLVRRGDDPDYVKLLDFGIARLDWMDGALSTQAGLIFGTAKYISPEGAEGKVVGPPADVYAIATMLYQMLAGRTPFEGDSPVALLVQHTHAPPAELRSIARASYVPAPLSAVIMANLSKNPSKRAQNARAFGRDLIAAARASGLFPDALAPQPTLVSPTHLGAVKLASKERTQEQELSVELATKIGGVAMGATEVVRVTTSVPTLASVALRDLDEPPRALLPSDATLAPASHAPSLERPHATIPAHPSPSRRVQVTEGLGSTVPGSPLPDPLTTMQGTEATLHEAPWSRQRGSRTTRIALMVACVVLGVPALLVGGRTLGGFGATPTQTETLDDTLDEAREHLRRRAWDMPPQHNFKDVTDRALVRWPNQPQLIELRHEAAEKIVTDALGRKYAKDPTEATRLARLALELDPNLTTAQHLVEDLSAAPAPDVVPMRSGAPASDLKPPRRGRDPRPALEPRGAQPSKGAAGGVTSSPAQPAMSTEPPPSPAPQPSERRPSSPALPTSSTARPWL